MSKSERKNSSWFWMALILLALAAIYVLQEILLPFVLGFVIAYMLDPLVDWLEKIGRGKRKRGVFSRGTASLIALSLLFSLIVSIVSLLVPVLQSQIRSIVMTVPRYFADLMEYVKPYYADILGEVGVNMNAVTDDPEKLSGLAGKHMTTALELMNAAFKKIVESGTVLFSLFSVVVIVPIVSFYLLRDWDKIIVKVDGWLPREHAETIRDLVRQIDESLSGFVRGQGLVCLTLGVFYAVCLSLVGLDFGLTIGLFTGFMSFVPYFGSGLGMLISIVVAIKEFSDWFSVGLVAGIFIVGQILEGYVLSPRLVGERTGLHAVWIIFALMAGGALFGFVGILLAVPVAAALGVLSRFAIDQYKTSEYYRG